MSTAVTFFSGLLTVRVSAEVPESAAVPAR
jgi:hypothetical protein